MNIQTSIINIVLLLLPVLAFGCGRNDLPRKTIHGNVTCGGRMVVKGSLRFTPLDTVSQLPSTSAIVANGQYHIGQFGGIPLGKYRVQIIARGVTGRKVQDSLSDKIVDETISIVPQVYAGAQSPLEVEVTPNTENRIDIVIP